MKKAWLLKEPLDTARSSLRESLAMVGVAALKPVRNQQIWRSADSVFRRAALHVKLA
jgi:hypothetical protein